MLRYFLLCLTFISVLWGNEAVIEDVAVIKNNSLYSFSVRILHEDSGWEHYVNRYEILDKEGNILATRILVHPHTFEQPFTRSLAKVKIENLRIVYVRAHDSVDGYSRPYEVTLP